MDSREKLLEELIESTFKNLNKFPPYIKLRERIYTETAIFGSCKIPQEEIDEVVKAFLENSND